MPLGDGFLNHFLSNILLLPHVAYTYIGRGHACETYNLPSWLAGWPKMRYTPLYAGRKVLGIAKLSDAKNVCPFGFLLFTGCQQWDDSIHTFILYVLSHVTVIQLSNLGHMTQQSVSLYRKAVFVCVCMGRAGFCTVQHNTHESFENHASCKQCILA